MELFFTSVLSVVVVLGIMVLIHEFGHYAAAKLFGVRVEVFSVGFGKRLWGFRRGETDYRVSVLPLGGYVKMSGENPMEARTGDPGEFMSHPRWQRFVIAFAGPFMNIILAVALLTGVFMVRNEVPAYLDEPAVIGYVVPNSSADKAGLRPGDRIVDIDGIKDPKWNDVSIQVALSPNQPLTLGIERGSQFINASVTPPVTGPDQMGADPGFMPAEKVQVDRLEAGMPAEKAGIQKGDYLVAVNGEPLRNIRQLVSTLQATKDTPVKLTVERSGQTSDVTVTPVLSDTESGDKAYRLGFASALPIKVEKLPFGAALAKSVDENKRFSGLILELVRKMVQHKVSMKQIDGPIGIAKASGEAAMQPGWSPIIRLTAMISLNLGIFNLFPIPIMDGGVILLLFIESLMRRDISMKVKERIYQVAFVLLVLFAAVVIFNDLTKTVPGLAKYLG